MPSTFPSPAWDLAWLGYEVHCQAVGHAPRSIQSRRSSVLTLARCHPATGPEAMAKADLIRHFARRHPDLTTRVLADHFQLTPSVPAQANGHTTLAGERMAAKDLSE